MIFSCVPLPFPSTVLTMHLMYTLDENGNRVYTLKKITDTGKITKSAHPASFGAASTLTIPAFQPVPFCLFSNTCDMSAFSSFTAKKRPGPGDFSHQYPLHSIFWSRIAIHWAKPEETRFSPDDKFSRHRVIIKKRFGVLLTQLPSKPM
ncbi:h aca ribonucleoprotein complex subunit 3 [Moniliophthora roreri]|nr:h aca ribonucleoprotein complex subunit 3 [Moniliophthora roreri]